MRRPAVVGAGDARAADPERRLRGVGQVDQDSCGRRDSPERGRDLVPRRRRRAPRSPKPLGHSSNGSRPAKSPATTTSRDAGGDSRSAKATTSSRPTAATVSAAPPVGRADAGVAEQGGVELLDGDVLRIGRAPARSPAAGAASRARTPTRIEVAARAPRRPSAPRPAASWVRRRRQPHGEPSGGRRRVEVGAAQRQRVGELLGASRPAAPWVRQRPAGRRRLRARAARRVSGTSKTSDAAITYWPGQW